MYMHIYRPISVILVCKKKIILDITHNSQFIYFTQSHNAIVLRYMKKVQNTKLYFTQKKKKKNHNKARKK